MIFQQHIISKIDQQEMNVIYASRRGKSNTVNVRHSEQVTMESIEIINRVPSRKVCMPNQIERGNG